MSALDLVRYNHHLWKRFADFYVQKCTWEELSHNHETSHQSIANVSMHAINMEDWFLHYVLPGKEWDGPKWDGFRDAPSMQARVREVTAKTESFLKGRKPADLSKEVTLHWGGGKTSKTTLETLLHEVVNEATHHRGEVLAMLWRIDKEPPYESYLEWKTAQPT
ncbi:MAG TPA: DinB family protein [Candidatus Thermoplasmatota archaeon]|nr:DinB family protein [Candidatus Thermoplasmatota archaeon]